ncbi:Lipoprotein releasing system transmembrane protein LolC [Planctomycetales bacterium 10988]|nr:Lipoprotein releasing system transmembrane protein LolC [Planctomycetales bacterium 10988]
MYKLLLSLRYLRSRYIALASIISVMLGVATMIVVNSVMAGFSFEMKNRIHGILSDVVFESHSLEGFYDPQARMREIEEIAGEHIAGMTPIVCVPAMLSFEYGGRNVTRPVQIIGIDEDTKDSAGDYSKYLLHPQNREKFSFALKDGGYDIYDHQGVESTPPRDELKETGWPLRRKKAEWLRRWEEEDARFKALHEPRVHEDMEEHPLMDAEAHAAIEDPFKNSEPETPVFDMAKDQRPGIVLGFALASYRAPDGRDRFLVRPGEDVQLTFPTAGTPPRAVDGLFTVVDLYESKMNEYDSNFVFVPIRRLQELRGMIDPQTGVGYATAIQLKLKDPSKGDEVRDMLRSSKRFPEGLYGIYTWKDKQGPLLQAVAVETAMLNVLLFLIIAVAGFGILATFFMIVVEKTRDIGILKALGASSSGVMGIFLSYGLSLGIVGSGVGMAIGLLMVAYLNPIADVLAWVMGQEVFDPTIYYFHKIPAIVDPWTVTWIVIGAMLIAVLASILPAIRAACLHPVEAFRYE